MILIKYVFLILKIRFFCYKVEKRFFWFLVNLLLVKLYIFGRGGVVVGGEVRVSVWMVLNNGFGFCFLVF